MIKTNILIAATFMTIFFINVYSVMDKCSSLESRIMMTFLTVVIAFITANLWLNMWASSK